MGDQKLPLNAGQQKAASEFFQFLISDEKEMNIAGPGGTGKTFLMGHMIDQVLPEYQQTCQLMGIPSLYNQVIMTATTNKAAEVLSHSTKRPCSTIHSWMGLRVSDDYGTGKSILRKSNSWKVHYNEVIFVDECPMIDSPLYKHIQEGTNKCKVIYVGDDCQMAPVKEPISPIYTKNMRTVELLEPMRTSDIHLQALNETMRNRVPNAEFGPIKLVPGVIDHLNGPEMEEAIREAFIQSDNKNRIMAYTNDRVLEFNEHIREMRQLPTLLTPGECLICNSAFMEGSGNSLPAEARVTVVQAEQITRKTMLPGDIELEYQEITILDHFNCMQTVNVPTNRSYFTQVLKYYAGQKDWATYFSVKNNYPDLREYDAGTVYKAQGSSYDTAFIDIGNIGTCNRKDIVARMLYVGVSRARKRVVFYGELPEKYGYFV
ncbi:MAG: AAA family ATPase [Bacteroides thetaiotaomicron]